MLVCYGGDVTVEAAYDYASGRASEKITGTGWTYASRWNCANDPWVAPGNIACGNSKIQIKSKAGVYAQIPVNYPLSAYQLTTESRHVLAAQLNNTLNAAAQTPAVPAVLPSSSAMSAISPAPSK